MSVIALALILPHVRARTPLCACCVCGACFLKFSVPNVRTSKVLVILVVTVWVSRLVCSSSFGSSATLLELPPFVAMPLSYATRTPTL